MSGPIPRASVRILARIQKQRRRAPQDEILQRLAYLTVHHAALGSPDPFARACLQLREAWGFQLDCERAPWMKPQAIEAKPSVSFVDARDGSQWNASAIAYLRWRQGLDWRRKVDQRDPVVEERACAIHLLTQVENSKHDAAKLEAFLALRIVEPAPTAQLPLHFPFLKMKRAAAAA